MKRYLSRPKGWDDEWRNEPGPVPVSMTVFERDHRPSKSCLLDIAGNELWAEDRVDPIGFIRFEGNT